MQENYIEGCLGYKNCPLQKPCYPSKKQKQCGFGLQYKLTEISKLDKKNTKDLKNKLRSLLKKTWGKQYKKYKPGKKDMTARPLEDSTYEIIKKKITFKDDYSFEQRKSVTIDEKNNIKINADCLLTKRGKPLCIISIKTNLTKEAMRENFSSAFLFKKHNKKRKYILFCLNKGKTIDAYAKAYKNIINNVYCLSGAKNNFDNSIKELKRAYAL